MNTSTISHPALVALQGRLRTAQRETLNLDQSPTRTRALTEIETAIVEIDQWLTVTKDQRAPKPIDAEYWLALAPVRWYGEVEGMRAKVAEEAVQALDSHITAAARVRAYLQEWLNHGHGEDLRAHRAGVRAGNRLVTKIRRALGYSYPKQDLNF